jgi:hypothetical protein
VGRGYGTQLQQRINSRLSANAAELGDSVDVKPEIQVIAVKKK